MAEYNIVHSSHTYSEIKPFEYCKSIASKAYIIITLAEKKKEFVCIIIVQLQLSATWHLHNVRITGSNEGSNFLWLKTENFLIFKKLNSNLTELTLYTICSKKPLNLNNTKLIIKYCGVKNNIRSYFEIKYHLWHYTSLNINCIMNILLFILQQTYNTR